MEGDNRMKDVMYLELKECNKAIRSIEDTAKKEWGYRILKDTIQKICELSNIGRKQGLLALEDAVFHMEELQNYTFLKKMMMLIVDGTYPDLVEEIGLTRYFALGVEGIEALQYILMIHGSLAIQAGENPRVIEEKLYALVPEEVAEIGEEPEDDELWMKVETENSDMSVLDAYYHGDIAAVPGDESYYLIKITDYAITSLDDRSIQRLLRELENGTLALAMKGLSGECRRRILTNMSERLALMVAEDMKLMGAVRIKDTAEAISCVFEILMKLISCEEIFTVDEEALCLFHRLFGASEIAARREEIAEIENELLKIMREYSLQSNRKVNNS